MAVKIQLRRGTAAEWTAANPILLEGEMGLEKDTGKWKAGDSSTAWTSLGYGQDGVDGKDLEYLWNGTELGVRKVGDATYTYVDLKGANGNQGIQGLTGPAIAVIDNLASTSVGDGLSANQGHVLNDLVSNNVKKLEDNAVCVSEFGAVGDYYLEDGSINPNPTDNTIPIQNTFNASNIVKLTKGAYYCSGAINLPKNAVILGNNSTLIFAGNGLNVGNYIWGWLTIKDLNIKSTQTIQLGDAQTLHLNKALYCTEGHIVYPVIHNLSIEGFEYSIDFRVLHGNSNCTWGDFYNVKIQYCDYGPYFYEGWANTIKMRNIILNYIAKESFTFDACDNIHNCVIDHLVMESCSADRLSLSSPFNIKNITGSNDITVRDIYVENIGFSRAPTSQAEIDLFTTTGTPVPSNFPPSESQSWELAGEVFSSDTGLITLKELNGASIFRVTNSPTTILKLENLFITTGLYGIASFTGSPIIAYINTVRLMTDGYSFCNTRNVFTNTTPASLVTIYTNNFNNQNGGTRFTYGDSSITVKGDLFGGNKSYQGYDLFTSAANIAIAPGVNNVVFPRTQGNLGIPFDTVDPTKFKIPATGVYMFSAPLAFSQNIAEGVKVSIFSTWKVKIGSFIPNIQLGVLNSFTGVMYLSKGDLIQFQIENLSASSVNLLGTGTTANYLIISKIN